MVHTSLLKMLDMESIWIMNEWMRSFWKVKTFLYCFLCYAYILWMYLKVLFRRKNFTKFHTKVCIWNEVGNKVRTKNMYVHTYLVKKCLILAAKQKRSSCFQNGNVMLLWRVYLLVLELLFWNQEVLISFYGLSHNF